MRETRGLNAAQIKLIAIVCMTIDHLAWTIWPGFDTTWYVMVMHIIGRITAPVMFFFIAEGCLYTRSLWKYAGRLFAFAVISHFAYCFAFGIPFFSLEAGLLNRTSIMWPLALAVLTVAILKETQMSAFFKIILMMIFAVLSVPGDWSAIAYVIPLLLYYYSDRRRMQMIAIVIFGVIYAGAFCLTTDLAYGLVQLGVVLSVPILCLYNEQPGTWKARKWFFYIYYPAHLALIGILRLAL